MPGLADLTEHYHGFLTANKGNFGAGADGSAKGKAVLIGVMDNHASLNYANFMVI